MSIASFIGPDKFSINSTFVSVSFSITCLVLFARVIVGFSLSIIVISKDCTLVPSANVAPCKS